MATSPVLIQVRNLSPTGDPLYGSGLQCFVTNLQAVALILRETLLFLENEFFTATNQGTPLFQQLLDHPITDQAVAMILQNRILSVPYVTGVSQMIVSFGASGRTLQFTAMVQTVFGPVQVGN